MIPKSGNRFSLEIMANQKIKIIRRQQGEPPEPLAKAR